MRIYFSIILCVIATALTACQSSASEAPENLREFFQKPTYKEILATGIKPALTSDFNFPNSHQFKNGCFAFAVNHAVEHMYDLSIDLREAEKKIGKPRDRLWSSRDIKAFLNEYDLKMEIFHDAETLFQLLSEGTPVIVQYFYPLDNGQTVGHIVAAYSFDDEGVWISESISGTHMRIPYSDVFDASGRKAYIWFARVER